MTEKLKPCPFCGGNKVSISQGLKGGCVKAHYIECEDCAASSEMHFSIDSAVEAWNSRTNMHTELESAIDYLKEEIDCYKSSEAELINLLKSANFTYLGGEYVACIDPDKLKKVLLKATKEG